MVFATLTDLVEYVDALADDEAEGGYSWSGGSLAEARDLAIHGWPEGARKAGEIAGRIADRVVASPTETSSRVEIGYDVAGAAYDAGAYAQGIPESWAAPQLVTTAHAVRIVINIVASAGVGPDVIMRRGLAVAAIALVLQANGYPVTVDVLQHIRLEHGHGERETVMFNVANASSGSPLDVDRLVFALAHPMTFRRLCAAVSIGRRGSTASTRWGDSRPASGKPDGLECDIFVGGAHLEEAARWEDGGEAWVLAEYLRQTEAK
jgi:hypothetical protein